MLQHVLILHSLFLKNIPLGLPCWLRWIIWIDTTFYSSIHQLMDMDCFHFFAVLNNTAMNTVQFWFRYMLLFFLSIYVYICTYVYIYYIYNIYTLRVDSLGHIVTLCLTSEEMTNDRLFSKPAAPFCIPTNSV